MKIRISEVWNDTGKSVELAIIESKRNNPAIEVYDWILENRPDLNLANNLFSHGFHAVQVQ